ncbi:MAG: hypothetical protein M1829_005598 [Trizodia sp. TS-e1964]|nr:MAG: hypothetical protein M1829_005598 [Trizodia sp. TS-e1964]
MVDPISSNTSSDPLADSLVRDRRQFYQNNQHCSKEELESLWTNRIYTLAYSALRLADDADAPVAPPHIPMTSVSRSFSTDAHSFLRPTLPFDTPAAIRPVRSISQQSAPAAASMAKARMRHSLPSSNPGALSPFPAFCSSVDPPTTATATASLDVWKNSLDNEPFSAYTTSRPELATRRLTQPLPQLTESDLVDPAIWLTMEGVTAPITPANNLSLHPTSPSFPRYPPRNARSFRHRASTASDQAWTTGFLDTTSQPPSTPTTELTTAASTISDMTRQGSSFESIMDPSISDNVAMLRMLSTSDFSSHLDSVQSCADAQVPTLSLSNANQSQFVGGIGGVTLDLPSKSQQTPLTPLSSDPFASASIGTASMIRSASHQSAASSSSQRAAQRRKETLEQAKRPIRPKEETEATPMSRNASAMSTASAKTRKTVTTISRRRVARVTCLICPNQPNFKGEHELVRHCNREHNPVRKLWVANDISEKRDFLSKCKHCRNGKRYGAYYNLAAHLRRAHFEPKKSQAAAPTSPAVEVTMDMLKPWMKLVVVEVDNLDTIDDHTMASADDVTERAPPDDFSPSLPPIASELENFGLGNQFSTAEDVPRSFQDAKELNLNVSDMMDVEDDNTFALDDSVKNYSMSSGLPYPDLASNEFDSFPLFPYTSADI